MEYYLEYFFPGACYDTVVSKLSPDPACLKMAVGRTLSLAVILGAVVVKLPQIVKILRARSVENLSFLANMQELAAVTFTSSYSYAKGFPFSTWGESFFIAIQVVAILALIFVYNKNLPYLLLFIPCYSGAVWFLTSEHASLTLLSTLQGCVIPLVISSRLTQVVTTYMNSTTGQLSFITAFLNWAGTAARIFTTLQETQDSLMIATYCTSFTVNTIVLFQFYWYWNVDKKKKSV